MHVAWSLMKEVLAESVSPLPKHLSLLQEEFQPERGLPGSLGISTFLVVDVRSNCLQTQA